MRLLRTEETYLRYEDYKKQADPNGGCTLCEKTPIREFENWTIVGNDFPYDRIAEVHHTLITKKHIKETELSEEEKQELLNIKKDLDKDYHFIMEATAGVQSIPEHFHLHLIKVKP